MFINTSTSGVVDFYLDLAYGVMFLLTLIIVWTDRSYRSLYYTFYIPLIILLCFTLIDRRGLASSVENNIYVGLIVIALTMRSKDARKFSVALIIGTLISLAIVEFQNDFLSDFTNYSSAKFNYIFMAIGTVVITFYSKRLFENWKKKLFLLKNELTENYSILAEKQAELEKQTQELEFLNKELESKVNERLILLNKQKQAMEKYLYLTTKELQKEYRGIHELTESVIKLHDHDMKKMMNSSSRKLEEEIDSLVNKLKAEQ